MTAKKTFKKGDVVIVQREWVGIAIGVRRGYLSVRRVGDERTVGDVLCGRGEVASVPESATGVCRVRKPRLGPALPYWLNHGVLRVGLTLDASKTYHEEDVDVVWVRPTPESVRAANENDALGQYVVLVHSSGDLLNGLSRYSSEADANVYARKSAEENPTRTYVIAHVVSVVATERTITMRRI